MFSVSSPIFFVVLLAFTFLARWPTFDARHYPTDESLYLAVGERLANGGVLYRDAWENKPPLMLWFYALNVVVFGKNAVWAVRVWACLILAWSAVRCYRLAEEYKFISGRDAAFTFLFVAVFSTPWYAAELNCELFILPMAIEAVRLTAKHCVDDKRRWEHLFFAGVYCGAAFFSKYQGLHITMALLIALFVVSTPTSADITTFFGGITAVAVVVLSILYSNGAWADFWDVGVVYNLDYIRLPGNPGDNQADSLIEYLKIWGLPFAAALAGIWAFRAGFYQIPIRQRKFGTLMMIWFVLALAPLFVGRVYLHYFWFVLPPVLFWAPTFVFGKFQRSYPKLSILTYASFWAIPVASGLLYFIVADTERYARFARGFRPGGWVESVYDKLHPDAELTELKRTVDELRARGVSSALVTGFQPELYRYLELSPETKYTNFGIAYFKAEWRSEDAYTPISDVETQADFFAQLYPRSPKLIIDPDGIWESMRQKLPPVIDNYRQIPVGKYTLYLHPNVKWEK